MVLKGYLIKDTDTKVVLLPRGTWDLNGTNVEVTSYKDEEVQVSSFEGIRKFSLQKNVSHYESPTGEKTLDIKTHRSQEVELLSKRELIGEYEEYDGYKWLDLESEFAYKTFQRDWIPIYREVVTYSDNIPVVIEDSGYLDTGNPFIKNAFANGGKIETISVYVYNRPEAWQTIVANKMKDLGLERVGDSRSGLKEWSNSNHSVLEYLKMAGSYVWSKRFNTSNSLKGSLDGMIEQYNADKKEIEHLLDQKYFGIFGKFQNDKTEVIKQAISKASSALSSLVNIDPKAKSYNTKNMAIKSLREAVDLLKDSFIES